MEGPTFSRFDTESTAAYKYASWWSELAQLSLPLRFMYLIPSDDKEGLVEFEGKVFSNMYDQLAAALGSVELDFAYQVLHDAMPDLSEKDVLGHLYEILAAESEDEEDILERMNAYAEQLLGERIYTDKRDLQTNYDSWREQVDREFAAERMALNNKILPVQAKLEELAENDWAKCTPVTITAVKMSYSPEFEGRAADEDDGLEVFDSAEVSQYVPYIKYVDGSGRVYSKVFSGDKSERDPNYALTIIPPGEKAKPHHLYFTLWLGEQAAPETRAEFFRGVYSLRKNRLDVETPVATAQDAPVRDTFREYSTESQMSVTRVRAAFPRLELGEGRETKCRAEFTLLGFDYDEAYMLDVLLNAPLFYYHMYLDENSKPAALKRRLDLHARSFMADARGARKDSGRAYIKNKSLITFNFRPGESEVAARETEIGKDGAPRPLQVPAGDPHVRVRVTRCKSRADLYRFLPLFRVLMADLANEYPDVEGTYQALPQLLGNFAADEDTASSSSSMVPRPRTPRAGRSQATIDELKRRAPKIFVPLYSTNCQAGKQPSIVENEDAPEVARRGIQTLPFPRYSDPEFHVYCADGMKMGMVYPSVMPNNRENRGEYPWLPCCYQNDQTGSEDYRLYAAGQPPREKRGTKTSNLIKTNKFLPPGGKGLIHESIARTLATYREGADISRSGVERSKNSLLHCVLTALADPAYVRSKNKEAFAAALRPRILETVLPTCMMQEMYDYTLEEISAAFADPDLFLDPSLFYRALEEFFDVNIYCFTTRQEGELDLPRHKLFHARPARVWRRTVLVYKNLGSRSDNLDYPQCELIVDSDVKIFGGDMAAAAHAAMQDTARITSWTIENQEVEAYDNMHSYVDLVATIGVPPVGQFVDRYGKMRSLTFDTRDGPVTLFTIAGQPGNYPIVEQHFPARLPFALALFPRNLSAVNRDSAGRAVGCWFQLMDIRHALYMPVSPASYEGALEEGPAHPLAKTGRSFTDRLRRLRRTLHLVTSVIRWIYDIHRRAGGDVVSFFEYLQADDYAGDSLEYYDLSRLSRFFPAPSSGRLGDKVSAADTVQDAIAAMSASVPSLCRDGHIVLYNSSFMSPLLNMLRDYENITADRIPDEDRIHNFFQTDADFTQRRNTKVFTSRADLEAWWESLRGAGSRTEKVFGIRTRLTSAMSKSSEPLLYEDPQGYIYVVQNVVNTSKMRAMTVSERWETYLHNPGFNAPPAARARVHKVYGIDHASNLVLLKDNSNGSPHFLSLLYYGLEENYSDAKITDFAALLRIL